MRTDALLVAGLALAALVLYGVLGGADFGGGIWDLFAAGPRKREQRDAIAKAMGPVWEANHVWLIFLIVLLFACFPPSYAALSRGLFGPLHLVLVGVILRGAAFVFRAYGPRTEVSRGTWGAVFGAASTFTPVLLGDALGVVSSGALRVNVDAGTVRFEGGGAPWFDALPLATGAFALAVCSYVAAVLLAVETRGELREDFRKRALGAGTAVVALSVLVLPLLRARAPHLWGGLFSARALPVMAVGATAALGSGAALWARRHRLARVATIAQVACLLGGWGLAMYPHIVYPDVTLWNAAGPAVTLRFVLYSLPVGGAMLVPSLWFLFKVFKGERAKTEG